MDIDRIELSRLRLNAAAKARFDARTAPRELKLEEVDKVGVLAAAGLEASVRRALHLTVAEGRAAVNAVAVPSPPQVRRFEAIVGFNDTAQVSFLEVGQRAARSVCRLLYDGQPIGTGFMVGPGLMITNNHVIPDADAAAGFIAQFNYQLDVADNPLLPVRFGLDPTRIFVTSPEDQLDFSLIAVQPRSATGQALTDFGWLPLNPAIDKVLEGEPILIVQHPEGREKQVCLFNSEMVDRADVYIYYTTDTEPGSSGSPVFNRQWQLVGLHHASAPSGVSKRGIQTAANEGVRVSAIIAGLRSAQGLIGDPTAALALLLNPQTQDSGRPVAPPNTTPVQPGLGLGGLAAEPEGRTVLRPRDAAWFDHPPRAGYAADFLGVDVPAPALSPALKADLTTFGDGQHELKYMHHSVVMCASRRMAYYAAVNIDGASAQPLARTDRDPAHPQPVKTVSQDAEAADVWWLDGRIPASAQVGAEVYDRTDFDYGHLTRRLDPVWSTDAATLRVANDDTFFMTNCAPQHRLLNERTWARLENAVREAALHNRLRFSVFTGPVFDPRDPMVLGVQCPLAYWKVIAYRDGAVLRARGFMQWQTKLVDEIRQKLEGLTELADAEEYHVPIADIARLTALDFGPLMAADEKPAGSAPEPVTEVSARRLLARTSPPRAARRQIVPGRPPKEGAVLLAD